MICRVTWWWGREGNAESCGIEGMQDIWCRRHGSKLKEILNVKAGNQAFLNQANLNSLNSVSFTLTLVGIGNPQGVSQPQVGLRSKKDWIFEMGSRMGGGGLYPRPHPGPGWGDFLGSFLGPLFFNFLGTFFSKTGHFRLFACPFLDFKE